jgi:hypothetical protein
MTLHDCRNPGCRCAGTAEHGGFCSYECATGEPSRLVPAACPCWHAPCVVGPFASDCDPRHRDHQTFAARDQAWQ